MRHLDFYLFHVSHVIKTFGPICLQLETNASMFMCFSVLVVIQIWTFHGIILVSHEGESLNTDLHASAKSPI